MGQKSSLYVSCNSATQARDLALMYEQYKVSHIQPVDMFPQTHHVENIAVFGIKIVILEKNKMPLIIGNFIFPNWGNLVATLITGFLTIKLSKLKE